MRKSIKIAPGVRLNVSKTGIGGSVRAGGVGYSAHSSGRKTVSARSGIPGVTYQKSISGGSRRATAAQPPAPRPPKPGLLAPKGEKQLYKAIQEQDIDAIKRVGDEQPDFRVAAWSIAGLQLTGDAPEATRLLEDVFATGTDPADDKFVAKYLLTLVTLPIAPGVSAELPLSRDAVGLTLAELKQNDGDIAGAIDVVEQLEPTTYAAVSLAELYASLGRYDDIIELTEGIANEDDSTALLLCFRGIAFREQGFPDAAHEAFKEALRSRSRSAEIRHYALSERATNYVAQGKKGMARKDLERILAEDSDYLEVRERLAALSE
jgi:tetratricopeptide (TPR) repeat protein